MVPELPVDVSIQTWANGLLYTAWDILGIGVGAGPVGPVLTGPFFRLIHNIHNQREVFSERSFST